MRKHLGLSIFYVVYAIEKEDEADQGERVGFIASEFSMLIVNNQLARSKARERAYKCILVHMAELEV